MKNQVRGVLELQIENYLSLIPQSSLHAYSNTSTLECYALVAKSNSDTKCNKEIFIRIKPILTKAYISDVKNTCFTICII